MLSRPTGRYRKVRPVSVESLVIRHSERITRMGEHRAHKVSVVNNASTAITLNPGEPYVLRSGKDSQSGRESLTFNIEFDDRPVLQLTITGGGQIHWDVPGASHEKHLEANVFAPELRDKIVGRESGESSFKGGVPPQE